MIIEKRSERIRGQLVTILYVEGLIKLGESAAWFHLAVAHQFRDADLLIVDFLKVDYLDSTGIGELVGACIRLAKGSDNIIFTNTGNRIEKLLAVAGYDDAIRLFDTPDEVIAAFASDQLPFRSAKYETIVSSPASEASPAPLSQPSEIARPPKLTNPALRPLRVFMCHASNDKRRVRMICRDLATRGIDVWFDEEKLLPGHDWRREIRRALRTSDAILICLSASSVTKTGYVQSEIKEALEIADEQPDGTIFLIPIKLEACNVPDRLARFQWAEVGTIEGRQQLLRALNARAAHVGAVSFDIEVVRETA